MMTKLTIFLYYTPLTKGIERIFYTLAKPTIHFIYKTAINKRYFRRKGHHFYCLGSGEKRYEDSSDIDRFIFTRTFVLLL